MTLLRRLVYAGCVVAALALRAHAQTPSDTGPVPPENTLETWLTSGDPRLEAWGAHDAVVAHDQNLTPYLLSLASKWQPLAPQTCNSSACAQLSTEQFDERDAMAEVLDALIQMNASVPAGDLRNLAPDFGDYVAILLARLPGDESSTLSFDFYRSEQPNYALQYVSAALLALRPQPGFAADLLRSIKVYGEVSVVIRGVERPLTDSGVDCGAYLIAPRKNWPGIGQYSLSRRGSNVAFRVVGGDLPVYATRQESPRYINLQCSRWGNAVLRPDDRFRLVAEMLGVSPGDMPWRTAIETKIEYESTKQFDATLLAFVNEQEQKYRATAKALSDHGLMTSSEAETSLPELDLEIEDMRGAGAKPIPELSNLPPSVTWSYSQQ